MKIDYRRRQLIKYLAGGALAAPFLTLPGICFAKAPIDQRLLVVFLRGGLDSLAAVVPVGDRNYRSMRANLALDPGQLIPVNNFFSLHPNLATLAEFYRQRELIIYPAVASPYRERSHFDAQDLLENGTEKPQGSRTGWLNRAALELQAQSQDILALSLGTTVQKLLQGDARVTSWSPSVLKEAEDSTLMLISMMYESDPLFFDSINTSLDDDEMMDGMSGQNNKRRNRQSFKTMMGSAAKFLAASDGPRLAAVDIGGWDTHINQGTINGRLANNFRELSEGLTEFKNNTPTAVWKQTQILMITEFGRTVRPNGSAGTDHGIASCAFLLGGDLNGGRVVGKWPGLASQQLYEGRDLTPMTDVRDVIREILVRHLGISTSKLANII